MGKITNKNVLANKRKGIIGLFIGIVLVALCVIFIITGNKEDLKSKENIKDLNSIIIGNSKKEDQKASLKVNAIPYKFAIYDNTTDSYYILSDGEYLYVVYMSTSDYDKLNDEDIYDNPIEIVGITKKTTTDIKRLAIDAYNDSMEDDEDKLSLVDYDNMFGEVHLDLTVRQTETISAYNAAAIITGLFGVVMILIVLIRNFNYSRSIKKYDDVTLEMLDAEMNDIEAFYYDKSNLYLTKNYIIDLNGKFRALKYSDILWMYPFEHRVNGIRVSKSIKLLDSNGKTHFVANIDLATRKKKEIYEEIWNTIISKNDKIIVGYSKENIKHFNEVIKEIKKNRKNGI